MFRRWHSPTDFMVLERITICVGKCIGTELNFSEDGVRDEEVGVILIDIL